MPMIEIAPELRDAFPGEDMFGNILALEGKVYRAKEGRRTLLFEHKGSSYFAKIHMGIGWREIWKNLLSFRKPAIDAAREWESVEILKKIGVEVVDIVGKGVRGMNPAKRQSFVIMKALEETLEVEDFLKDLKSDEQVNQRTALLLKRAIIRRVAETSRLMHRAGINHRDYYLNHFHILDRDWSVWQPGEEFRLPLLDLHRAQIRTAVPQRWLAKDLGALLFSAIDCGITDRDIVTFLRIYLGEHWKKDLRERKSFWLQVCHRARKFYQKHCKTEIKLPGVFAPFS